MKQISSIVISFFFIIPICLSATIHGTVYDMSLNRVTDAIVEVDSKPTQRMVTINGSYSFDLAPGDFTITSSYFDGTTTQKSEEKITILEDGDYILDLFLFIEISDEESLDTDDIKIDAPYKKRIWPYILLIAIIFIASFTILYWKLLHKKQIERKIMKREDKDLEKIILILKKHGGRATQKEIRREIPLSEAKISLMITELESEKRIKRIKKGRGNIIILL